MAFLYAGLMSGVFTALTRGPGIAMLAPWAQAWGLAFLIAAPAGLILRPIAEGFADRLTGPKSEDHL
jgi:hypothetical protein